MKSEIQNLKCICANCDTHQSQSHPSPMSHPGCDCSKCDHTTCTTHPLPAIGHGQCARIYDRLASAPGQWIPMPELARAASASEIGIGISPRSRIYDLRRKLQEAGGHLTIEHRTERQQGQIHTFYRLIPTPDPSDPSNPS